jgi:hypothetical protein
MIYPSSIGSGEAVGATATLEFQTIRPVGIYLPEPTSILPLGIAPGEPGALIVGPALLPEGFGGEAFGQSTLKSAVLVSALASGEDVGAFAIAPGDWSIAVLPIQ